ncbi:MAG TPA: FtsX-like permease family protein [Spirochaetota bacterium]|nr:FtsX-like permease family protein [Spirochaetota bacterium]HNT11787.1 FtsX-like permease family protein [Spirochaetota bacterium]
MNREAIAQLAWRNVWRNKRRTILTLATIVVGCGMIILNNALAKGGHDGMINDAAITSAGHIQVHRAGYWASRTIDYAFQAPDGIAAALGRDRRIAAHTERIHAAGLLAFGANTSGGQIQGVDPAREPAVTNLHTRVLPGGRYLTAEDSTHAIVGETLAKNLGAKVGDVVSIISQGLDGSIAAEKLTVVGVFRSGNPEYDQTLLVMPIEQARATFSMERYIHAIVVRLADIKHDAAVIDSLRASLPETERSSIEVLGWDTLMPELVQFIALDDISAYIFDFILFLVVAFGILNTVQMAVFERTREFGVMLAVGTRPGQVVRMVLIESAIISTLGVIAGGIAGFMASLYFKLRPLDFSDYSNEMATIGVSMTKLPADATVANIAVTAVITLALTIVFAYFPARRASKLKPVEAIRQL